MDLKHTGAVLKGPFSRYDYQRQPDSGVSSIRSFKVWTVGLGHWGKYDYHICLFFCFLKVANYGQWLGLTGVQVVE